MNLTAFGVLALRSSGAPVSAVARSAKWLRAAQNGDGGWGFQSSAPSDADSTGAALQGLAASGGSRHAMRRGTAYLRRTQKRDGGFALGGGGLTNSQSTAWAIQGLIAAGAEPSRVREHGHSPLDYLAKRQRGDGHYAYSPSSDQTPVWVTGQAIVAAKRKAFPLSPVPRPPHHAAARHHNKGGGQSSGAPSTGSAPPATGPAPGSGSPGGGGGSAGPGGGDHGSSPETGRRRGAASGSRSGQGRHPGAAVPVSASVDPAGAAVPDDGGSDTAIYVLGGLGALALALAAGFVWYRRRLP